MKKLFVTLSLCFLLVFPMAVFATPYSSIVTFGDSLSDNGPAEDYVGFGTWSDGSVWAEYLADKDHLNCDLYDYAFGGALTGLGNGNPSVPADTTGLTWQVNTFLASGFPKKTITDDVLFTIWAGGNDFLNLKESPNDAINHAVNNIDLATQSLINAGAKNILILTLPNLGATPLKNGSNGEVDPAAQWISSTFNTRLETSLDVMESTNTSVNFYTLDVYDIMQKMLLNPGDYGFTNVIDAKPSIDATGYLFWDSIHPTTQAHELIADFAQAKVAPVPEPATMLLLGSGLLGLAGFRKKMKK